MLPSHFDGFTLLHISDLHVDISEGATRRLNEILPGMTYDICILTGDYRGATFGTFAAALEGLARARAHLRGPIYGVLGKRGKRAAPRSRGGGIQARRRRRFLAPPRGCARLLDPTAELQGGRTSSCSNSARIQERARESLKSHGRWVANCDSLCARAPIRLDHVTLRSGAAALTVATNAFWVPFRPKASSASQRG
jgi:hypothetical protein